MTVIQLADIIYLEGEKVPVKQFLTKVEHLTPLEVGYRSLTPMEVVVLKGCALGKSNEEIAKDRCFVISESTVDAHISNMSRKLGVSGKRKSAMMAHIARHFGLITEEDLNFSGSPFEVPKG